MDLEKTVEVMLNILPVLEIITIYENDNLTIILFKHHDKNYLTIENKEDYRFISNNVQTELIDYIVENKLDQKEIILSLEEIIIQYT